MSTFAKDVPLVSATAFNVSPQAIDDGTNDYGTVVNAGNGDWVLGSVLKGRRIMVTVSTGALTSTPTGLKVGLYKGDDANGTNGAVVTNSTTSWATPAGDTEYSVEMDLGTLVDDPAKYYSLGLSSNGGGSTSILAGASARFLDPVFKS